VARSHTNKVIVTHHTSYLPNCDYIVALQDGKVIEAGWRSDILQSKRSYAKSMIPKGIEHEQAVSKKSNTQSEETKSSDDENEERRAILSTKKKNEPRITSPPQCTDCTFLTPVA
jgi:ABC-type multidrug transport system ATPase subunit